MASESSSAILELNDADTEDTEACSFTDDARDAAPLLMEQGYDIAVKVDAPMKQLSTLETYVTYRVRCVCARWPTPPFVRRRYNHFKLLHKRLATHEWVAPPPLPPLHTARQQLDRYSATFVATRTCALHAFLERVAKHPIFSHSEDFRLFITTPDEEFDKVFKSENSALNLWGLSSALYSSGENKPSANGPRVKDPEWCSHAEYLSSLQTKLTTLCALTNKLQKGSLKLTTQWMNMKRVCDAWSVQAGGSTARAAAATAVGAAALARPSPPLRSYKATLPMMAAYAGAHLEKIKYRDQLHAAYVSGTNASGETHNKLEQCSEALRSELALWSGWARGDVRRALLELAHDQLARHERARAAWAQALRATQDANVEELFKTVSKTAVQNLSPSRCRSEMTPTETDRDLDDLENYSNDSDSLIERMNEQLSERMNEQMSERVNEQLSERMNETDLSERVNVKDPSERMNERDLSERINEKDMSERINEKDISERINEKDLSERKEEASECGTERSETANEQDSSDKLSNQRVKERDLTSERTDELSERSSEKTEWIEVEVTNDPLSINVSKIQDKDDFLSEILDDASCSNNDNSKDVKDSTSLEQSLKSDVVSDPLREFSDVDLS